mgnify:CR=1 FL=1
MKQMISNQVLQNTLEGLKEISRTEFCIIDTEGKVLATTFADFSIQPGIYRHLWNPRQTASL